MGGPAKPRELNRRGASLIVAVASLLIMAMLVGGVALFATSTTAIGTQRQQSRRALNIAEAGSSHALAILRGPLATTPLTNILRGADNNAGTTSDNGVLAGYGLTTGQAIPAAGVARFGGTYTVQILDDPGDTDGQPLTDSNWRLLVRCTGTLPDNSSAAMDVIIRRTPPSPGILVDGALTISGNPDILGACGGIHVNGSVCVSGTLQLQGDLSTTAASVSCGGSIEDLGGAPNPPLTGQTAIPVPVDTYGNHCSNPDYLGRTSDGQIFRQSTGTWHPPGTFGWSYSGGSEPKWDISVTPPDGKWCLPGNAVISGNPGSPGSPVAISLFTTGSIEVSGNPYLVPAAGEPHLLFAEGDLTISGNPAAGSSNYGGILYAWGHCQNSGNPGINGQLMCRSLADGAGDRDLVDENKINGNPQLTYNCGGVISDAAAVVAWLPRRN